MATINDLPFNDTPDPSDSLPIYKTASGVTQRTSVNQLLASGLSSLPTVQPVSGSGELWIDPLDGNTVKVSGPGGNPGPTNLTVAVSNMIAGTATDAGTLTGAEIAPLSRASGMIQATVLKIATFAMQLYGAVSVLTSGTSTSASTDQSTAINAAIALLARFPAAAPGGVIRLPPGVYPIAAPIVLPFGISLEGSGSDIYTSKIQVLPGFVGAAAIVVQDANASYLNAHVRNVGIDCANLSGVEGVLFYGAYRNSSVENVVVQNVAGNAHGVHVAPQAGGQSVCESFLLRDIYVLKAAGATSTASGVFLDTVQESTLINVKSFHGTNPGTIGGFSCFHLRDCRGVTIIGGAAVAGDNALYIEALNRNSVGIAWLNPTYENIGTANVKIRGSNGFTVSNVSLPQARIESPAAANFADVDNVAFLDIDVGGYGALLGANVNNSVVRGNGAGTIMATTGAQYTQLSMANAVRPTYQINPIAEVNAASSPAVRFTVPGLSGHYDWLWSANSTNDFGCRWTDRNQGLICNHSTSAQIVTWSQSNAFVKPTQLGPYAVASLPAVTGTGWLAYATNGRKVGEGAGSGTGVPVYYSNGAWRVFSTDAAVAA